MLEMEPQLLVRCANRESLPYFYFSLGIRCEILTAHFEFCVSAARIDRIQIWVDDKCLRIGAFVERGTKGVRQDRCRMGPVHENSSMMFLIQQPFSFEILLAPFVECRFGPRYSAMLFDDSGQER